MCGNAVPSPTFSRVAFVAVALHAAGGLWRRPPAINYGAPTTASIFTLLKSFKQCDFRRSFTCFYVFFFYRSSLRYGQTGSDYRCRLVLIIGGDWFCL